MAVVWDEEYDPLGPEGAFDKQGHHSHTNGSQYIAEHETKTTITTAIPWMPPSNIYETKLAYHIDVEVPGVENMNDFQVQWLAPRTLMVEAKVTLRPLVDRWHEENSNTFWKEKTQVENAVASTYFRSKRDDGGGDGGVLHRCPDTAEERTTRIVLEERKLGSWRRSFKLPMDVDVKKAKTGVKFGLLHISVLKKQDASDSVIEPQN